jgi:hypothetical protein
VVEEHLATKDTPELPAGETTSRQDARDPADDLTWIAPPSISKPGRIEARGELKSTPDQGRGPVEAALVLDASCGVDCRDRGVVVAGALRQVRLNPAVDCG